MIKKTYSDELHIKVYNSMISDNDDTRLTPEALYIYSLLWTKAEPTKERTIETSVDLLNFQSDVRFMARDSSNKSKLREFLGEIVGKGYLCILEDHIKLEEIKNNTYMTLVVDHNKAEELERGYEQLFYNEFVHINSPEDLMIYLVSKRFAGGYKGSYNRWAKMLNVSNKTAQIMLSKAEESGLIEVVRGEYKAYNSQDVNLYRFISQFNRDILAENELAESTTEAKSTVYERLKEVATNQTDYADDILYNNQEREKSDCPF